MRDCRYYDTPHRFLHGLEEREKISRGYRGAKCSSGIFYRAVECTPDARGDLREIEGLAPDAVEGLISGRCLDRAGDA